MLNRMEIIGRIGREPEHVTMNNGDQVVKIAIGVTEKWKQNGEQKERTEWFKCVSYNSHVCNIVRNYVSKGDLFRFVGKIQTRKYTDQQGAEKYITECVQQKFDGEFTLFPSNKNQQQSSYEAPQSTADDLDDSVPF